jgi:hypothetical protein
MATISNAQIELLMNVAGIAGDCKMVEICKRALAGSKRARVECAKVIAEAEAISGATC